MKHLIFLASTLVAFLFLSCERTINYSLDDIPDFEGLAAPAAGQGYQIHIPPFPVAADYEREIFVRKEIGNDKVIYANRFEVKCRPGTHHMIAYGYENENSPENPEIGLMRDQNLPDGRLNFGLTMGSGAMYCGAQEPEFVLQLPPGVAMRIPANSTLDINSHYFNLTDDVLFGEVFLNISTIPESEVQETLVIDDIDNADALFLPKGESTTIQWGEQFGRRTLIRQMFSHMHKRGVQFKVFKMGIDGLKGELVYVSNDYQHPPYAFFDPPLEMKAGEYLLTEVNYYNDTDRDLQFGVTSEDEMGILFYSKIEGI
ncbi:MAG: hypothetical protein AAFY71_25505 [Bacteroidota bacterium]